MGITHATGSAATAEASSENKRETMTGENHGEGRRGTEINKGLQRQVTHEKENGPGAVDKNTLNSPYEV